MSDTDQTSFYNTKDAPTLQTNTIDGRSSYSNITSSIYPTIPSEMYSLRDLSNLENAIDRKMASYRK